MRALALLALSSCVTQAVHSRPTALAAHEEQFAAESSASVEVEEGGTVRVASDHPLTVWIPSTTTLEAKRCFKLPKLPFRPCIGRDREVANADQARHVTVRELVSGCQAGDCLAKQMRDEPIEIARRTNVSAEAIGRTIAAVAVIGLSGYCFIECEDSAKTFGGVGIVIAIGLLYQPIGLLAR